MKHLFSILMLLISGAVIGQNGFCGTHYDKSMSDRLDENKKAYRSDIAYRSDEWLYIPIQFHIVLDKNGKGGIDPTLILDELCHVNNNYAPLHMKFYLSDDFNYISSSKLYSEPSHNFAISKIKAAKKQFPNAINMFIVNTIPSLTGVGRTLGYYTPAYDVLVLRKSEFGKKAQTVSHELGHFFSLAHPFDGWNVSYNEAEHGNPLTILRTPSGALIEFMDKSNCEIAADKVCDTPPDYNFGFVDPEGDCKLNGPILDYHGDTIKMMENNYMSYFFNCGDYEFSPMQIALMRADFKSNKRSFLRSDYIPDTTVVGGDNLNVIYPKDDEKTEYYDYINLDWEDIPGADNYLVKIGLKAQQFNSKFYLVHGQSNLEMKDLQKGKLYVWYVRPYNEGNTCGKKFKATTFRAGDWATGTIDLDNKKELSVYPNPITNDEFFINCSDDLGMVNLKIVSITGKTIEKLKLNLQKGKNKLNLTHSNYQNGMYSFIIDSKDKKYIRKVIVE